MIKILIADDDTLVRAGLKAIIPWEENGFEVIGEAWNGEDAYNKIITLKPDILITDIKMPKMDGLTLLKKLKSINISIPTIILSCFNEFELVREAMKYGAKDYILKLSIEPQELLDLLNEIKEKLQQTNENRANFSLHMDDLKYLFIKKLINQEIGSAEQVRNTIHNIGLSLSLQDYRLILFSSDTHESKITYLNQNKIIYNVLDQICNRYEGLEIVPIEETGYLLIQDATKMENLYRQISAAMKEYANSTINFGISCPLNDYKDFSTGFQQAEEALIVCNFYEMHNTIEYEQISQDDIPFITNELDQELYDALLSENQEKACKISTYLMNQLNEDIFPIVKCHTYISEILNIYAKVARDQNFSIHKIKMGDDNIFETMRSQKTYLTCEHALLNFTKCFISFLQNKRSGERSEILKIKTYVRSHYMDNIDLNTISDLVNITPSHLSCIFKKETGVNFSSYLTKIRMEAAKKLLQSPESPIYVVAEQSGYTNAGYFGKVFKKYWGISPEEFRKRN
ncbi:MAG TPA: response regulator [Candidatus Merdenecus merdavium]|nr:response regulator [Candidatus Merdenecus merdavium]